MPQASDFVETEAIPNGMPQGDTSGPQNTNCPICGTPVGKMVVTSRLPVQREDGLWGHVFLAAHPHCAFMYEQGL